MQAKILGAVLLAGAAMPSFADTPARVDVYVAGSRVGALVALEPSYYAFTPSPGSAQLRIPAPAGIATTPAMDVISKTNYLVGVVIAWQNSAPGYQAAQLPQPTEGQAVPQPVWYDSPACSGTSYFPATVVAAAGADFGAPATAWALAAGAVWGAPDPSDPNGSYYIAKGAVPQSVYLLSVRVRTPQFGVVCAPWSSTAPVPAYRVLPNDPAITGVPRVIGGAVTLRSQ